MLPMGWVEVRESVWQRTNNHVPCRSISSGHCETRHGPLAATLPAAVVPLAPRQLISKVR